MRACAIIAALLLAGCTSPHQVAVTDVSATAWRDSAQVTIYNADTLTLRDLNLLVRSNEAFEGDTLTLCVSVTSPDTLRYSELFTLHIPHSRHAASLRREAEIPYRLSVMLADTGNYQFTFRPTRPVRGVEAVGIHLLKNDAHGQR
ncbi:MAG: hypothetical protein RR996_02090 [Alistipes sp.]